MTMTDPIADMLTRIRNALGAKKEFVLIPYSWLKEQIAKILQEEGFISSCSVLGEGFQKNLQLQLKYAEEKMSVIGGLTRESTPGRRMYLGYREIHPFRKGMGVTILSTPKGLLTDQKARKLKVGGEILCKVW